MLRFCLPLIPLPPFEQRSCDTVFIVNQVIALQCFDCRKHLSHHRDGMSAGRPQLVECLEVIASYFLENVAGIIYNPLTGCSRA